MIDQARFISEAELTAWCDRFGELGLRTTGSEAHERAITLVTAELRSLDGIVLREDGYGIKRWRPVPEGDLEAAGALWLNDRSLPVAGAVPYSRNGEGAGPLAYVPRDQPITRENAEGRIVLRDFPQFWGSADALIAQSFARSADTDALAGSVYERPGRADMVLHVDLLAAGEAGAAGIVFAFDLPREQMAGYFDPHKGTHYGVPAVFVGGEEARTLRAALDAGDATARMEVRAIADEAETRNVIATLPGLSSERIVIVTHTDGNTWIQENGSATLLALARYFAGLPLEQRPRTLEFVFGSGHLHISREGSAMHSRLLDGEYDDGNVLCAFAIEHLGVRELAPEPGDGDGMRRLAYTGDPETLIWGVGDSPALRAAVAGAIAARDLPRTFVLPGMGPSIAGQIPPIASFGGIGTYFHTALIPTIAVITGAYALWAPSFGRDAMDYGLFRDQSLAAADVIDSLLHADRSQFAGIYADYRRARDAGEGTSGVEPIPPEQATAAPVVALSPDGYVVN